MGLKQTDVAAVVRSLAAEASIEATPGALASNVPLAHLLGPGTCVYVPFLPRADFADTVSACRHLVRDGLRPVPHLAARALGSQRQLGDLLSQLADSGVESLFLIAGDSARPLGPFGDTMRVLETGLLQHYGFKSVGIAGYPEGHPHIDTSALWRALAFKAAYARDTGTDMWLVSQFAFEIEPIAAWLRALRDAGVMLPVRIGVPGPARLRTLLRFAVRCGVGASAKALVRRPSLVRTLASRWTPDKLLGGLAQCRVAASTDPTADIHLFPFGGLRQSAEWLQNVRDGALILKAGVD